MNIHILLISNFRKKELKQLYLNRQYYDAPVIKGTHFTTSKRIEFD